jgi:hypothetical protein
MAAFHFRPLAGFDGSSAELVMKTVPAVFCRKQRGGKSNCDRSQWVDGVGIRALPQPVNTL